MTYRYWLDALRLQRSTLSSCARRCAGVRKQMKLGAGDMFMVPLDFLSGDLADVKVKELWVAGFGEGMSFGDDVSVKRLDPDLIQAARREEHQGAEIMGVCTKVPRSECLQVTGKKPIGTRWVGCNEGDDLHPNMRARLVAQ